MHVCYRCFAPTICASLQCHASLDALVVGLCLRLWRTGSLAQVALTRSVMHSALHSLTPVCKYGQSLKGHTALQKPQPACMYDQIYEGRPVPYIALHYTSVQYNCNLSMIKVWW
jgi:hypothetical protein